MTPGKALFGNDLRLPVDLLVPTDISSSAGLQKLQQRLTSARRDVQLRQRTSAAKRSRAYDVKKGAVPRVFRPGDRVYWKSPNPRKLEKIWLGPFVIVSQLSDTNYVIKGSSSVVKTIHVNQLKKCNDDSPLDVLRGRGRPRLAP